MSILSSFLYLSFDLYSPSPEEGLGDEFDLIDHSDLHILDFSKYTYSQSAPAIRVPVVTPRTESFPWL